MAAQRAAVTRHRWLCPTCGSGAMGGPRPRRDDLVRYCVPCSVATGRLVERTCPALERKRAAAQTVATNKRARARTAARSKRAERWVRDGLDLEREAKALWRLMMKTTGQRRPIPKIEMRLRHTAAYSGHAYYGTWHSDRIVVSLAPNLPAATSAMVLAHELAHCAAPPHSGHDHRWATIYVSACIARYRLRDRCANLGTRPESGYAVDRWLMPLMSEAFAAAATEQTR